MSVCSRLEWRKYAVLSTSPKAVLIALASLKVTRNFPGEHEIFINNGENVRYSVVLRGDILHTGQLGLPLSINSCQLDMVFAKPMACRFVQSIDSYAF